jgi:predicted transglutaminase-like cysteine proteinase
MKRLVASMLATAIVFAGTAAKADSSSDTPRVAQAAFIAEYDNTLAPLQFVKFCMNYRSECDADAGQQLLPSTDRAMDMLREVNASVNEAISPVHKPTDPIGAHWALAPSAGDCNDYAVTKRHQLIAMGFPQNALRLAVVLTNGGQGHLVLVARLPDGDVVLDNLSRSVRPWNAMEYEWISMQSSANPRFWVTVGRHGQRLQETRLASSPRSPL